MCMVRGEGLEPSFTGSKPVVLPLDDPRRTHSGYQRVERPRRRFLALRVSVPKLGESGVLESQGLREERLVQ